MFTLLLLVIYMAFISLGLPDSLLGSAWTVMRLDLGADLSLAGIISMIISAGTILSSFYSARLIKGIGTGKVTLLSVLMTAGALLGFAMLPSFWWLCVMAVPLGLGAGSVDAALNNFVALHCQAKHMSWLHCFWGVGATAGPIIMSFYLNSTGGWRNGYFTISMIQFALTAVLFFTLGWWKIFEKGEENEKKEEEINTKGALKLKGAKLALTAFFCYCAAEAATGLWGSSFLVQAKGMSADSAARGISLFYGGITVGRFLSGFLTMRMNNRQLIRMGTIICAAGTISLLMPLPPYAAIGGLALIGLGCAPIYPSMLHETPNRFGKENSQSLMGIQMGFAYIGNISMPPLMGVLASKFTVHLFPVFILGLAVIMLISSEKLNFILDHKQKS